MFGGKLSGSYTVMIMVKIKVCGITNPRDAKLACSFGADMIGVIVQVNVSTPRKISLAKAKKIFKSARKDVERVVVTMPETLEDVRNISDKLDVDYFQIHSPLSNSELREIGRIVKGSIIGVCSVKENSDEGGTVSEAKRIAEFSDLLLLDTHSPSGGGTGRTHDWKVSNSIVDSLETPIILAGGLHPDNVKAAIERVGPYGVDVASGVESEPGRKDPKLLRRFLQNAG